MSAIRGEKVTFRKKDIVALHHLPSAQVEDPLIVHCPPPRSRMRGTAKVTGGFCVVLLFLLAALVFTIESGIIDAPLSRQAQMALNGALGPRYRAEVGSTVIRFTSGLRLALEARDVNMIDQQSGQHLSTTSSMRMALDPLQLFRGRIAVTAVEAEGIALDTSLLPSSDPIRMDNLRVDAIPGVVETVFSHLDIFETFVERGGTDSVRISGIDIKLADTANGPVSLVVDNLAFEHAGPHSLQLSGQISINGEASDLNVIAEEADGHASRLIATLTHADLTPFALKRNEDGEIRQGLNAFGNLTLSAIRAADGVKPELTASLDLDPGRIYVDGDWQDLTDGQLNLAYDFDKETLEIAKSQLRLGATTLPFNGAIIDLDKLDPNAGKGFGIDALISGGTAAPNSGEQPLSFDLQATGRYLVAGREFQFTNMVASSPLGSLYGALHLRLNDKSPEISFAGQSQQMQTTAIKQLWPFWMAPKVRTWVLSNLFGGVVTDASISVFIPPGRLDEASGGRGLKLDENQLRISFDIVGTRLNVAGEIPPVRDTAAHFDLTGPRATISLKSGTSYFPSGRSVALQPGTFVMPATYDKPLMADIDLSVAGTADAVGELLTYKPIQVLQRAGFTPDDLKGNINAHVQAHFGLLSSQNPPPAEWKAQMKLTDVALAKPFSGRTISNLDGTLDADPQQVKVDGKADIDGVSADIDMLEPVDKNSGIEPQRVITTTLNGDQREKLLPGLSSILGGSVKLVLTRMDEDRQDVQLDLGRASLDLPWIGWSKGVGIPANAEFEISGPADNTQIRNFQLKGDGFGAAGAMVLGKGGLTSADFDSVKLSSVDDFALSLKRSKGGFDIVVSGASADARPIIARLKSDSDSGNGGGDGDATSISVKAKLQNIIGFNDEKIGNFQAQTGLVGSKLQSLNFSGITDSGEAVVSQMQNGGVINITSGDAGSVSRFADLYQHMQGGLLNLAIRLGAGRGWDGSLDVRRFSIVNEQRLHSIVSTPVGSDQRSLNEAVKRDIDTSSQRFQRGFARVVSRGGAIAIENGVLRGDQIGATFQGVVRDAKGNMDMTGTFMPAYGLNRLFAELPLIGVILGNGSDRGLIGITFKLTGKFDQPNLQINPLSVIAPGVFRQIFEFQ